MAKRPYKHLDPRSATEDGRTGYDLDDIARDVLLGLQDEFQVNQTRLALFCGMSQAELSRYLGDKPIRKDRPENLQQFRISNLTRLCNSIDQNPIQVFGRHPLYEKEARAAMQFPKDHLYGRYNATLRNPDARTLLPLLDEARKRGVLGDAIAAVQTVVEAAKHATPPARRRPSAQRQARRPRK